MNTDLPALPEPAHTFYIGDGKKPKAKYETFSAKQMLAFRAEAIAARDAEIARLGKLAADYFSAAVEAQELAEGLSAETARLQAALAAQQPAAVPNAHDIRAIVQQAYMALEELQGPGFLIGGVMHYRIGLILPKLNEAIDMLAAAPAVQPSRDREADRARFTDPVFNRWLDEGISDAGHTVWDAVGDTQAAWQGWENRPHYVGEQPAEAVAPVPSAAVLLAEQVLHMDMVTERGIRARDLARQVLDTAHDVHEGECAALLRELASYLSAGGYNAPAVNPQTYREKIIWGIEQVRAAAPSAQPVAVPQGWALETGTGGFGGKGDRWVCVRHSASQCWQDFYEGRDPVIFGFLNALAAAPSAPQKGDAA